MNMISLFISLVLLLNMITSHNILANPVHKLHTKYSKTSTGKSTLDLYEYLTKYGYNPCENQSNLNKTNGKPIRCQSNLESMIKDFQARHRLPITGKADSNVLKLTNTPRCGVKDTPGLFRLANPWSKKSFKWNLDNENLPSFGAVKTREQIRESFKDWAKYSPITFQETSQKEKADFDLAFVADPAEGSDGPGGTLAYAYFPTTGIIRFDAMEPWTEKYDDSNINLRLVATHEIGHALGLDHSYDPSSIMTPYYKPMESKDLLPKDDRDGIQALYGSKLPPDSVMVKHGLPHGGPGGGSFDDAVNFKLSPTTHCIGVQLFWKPDYLFAIRFIYQQDNSMVSKVYHGGFGNPDQYMASLLNETFMMYDGERINKVTWYVGTDVWAGSFSYVSGIEFYTTAGRTSRIYGSNKGKVYTESYEGFTLGYAKGRSGWVVDMLQFVWHYQLMVKHGLPHGGPGGGTFDDAIDLELPPTTHCIGVQLFWKPDYLFAIRFIYQQDNSMVSKVYHGGFGNPDQYMASLLNETFMMYDGERINKVTWYVGTAVWAGSFSYVSGIEFYTTAGRTSRIYGSNKGKVYTESYEGFTLGYAKGRSGWVVDMLQFVWHNQGTDDIVFGSTYQLVHHASEKVLDIRSFGTHDGANTYIWSNHRGKNQIWTIYRNEDDTVKLINPKSGKALNVGGDHISDGSNVEIYTDNGSNAQKWHLEPIRDGVYKLIHASSGKALDVAGGATADGTNVQIWSETDGAVQEWRLVRFS